MGNLVLSIRYGFELRYRHPLTRGGVLGEGTWSSGQAYSAQLPTSINSAWGVY